MIRGSWMTGGSVEATLELWASWLRNVKGRIRPLFQQERTAASAGLFLDALLGPAGSPRSRRNTTSCLRARLQRWPGASGPGPAACPVMDSMDEPRSPSLPSPAASIIVFPLPSTLSSSSFSGKYGVQRNRGQLRYKRRLYRPTQKRYDLLAGPA